MFSGKHVLPCGGVEAIAVFDGAAVRAVLRAPPRSRLGPAATSSLPSATAARLAPQQCAAPDSACPRLAGLAALRAGRAAAKVRVRVWVWVWVRV